MYMPTPALPETYRSAVERPIQISRVDWAVAVERGFDYESEEYASFHQQSLASVFQASAWLGPLYRRLLPTLGAEPLTITAREAATGRLALVLPFALRRTARLSIIEFADFGVSDYHMPIYADRDLPGLIVSNLGRQVRAALPHHDVVSLSKVDQQDILLSAIFPDARKATMRFNGYKARFGDDWAAWRSENVPGPVAGQLRRKRRKLMNRGGRFQRLDREDEIITAFEALRAFRAARFKGLRARDLLADQEYFKFYRDIALAGIGTNHARTYCIWLNGKPIAVVFGVAAADEFAMLLLGFDPSFAYISPGLLAVESCLMDSHAAGDTVFDFGIGDFPFKAQFGGQAETLNELTISSTLLGTIAATSETVKRELKRMLKPIISRPMPVSQARP